MKPDMNVMLASSIAEVTALSDVLRIKRKRIAMTNGCFDILHYGHIDFLHECRRYGDLLIVALNSDRSIMRLKGVDRPIMSLKERVKTLKSLRIVHSVIIFNDEHELATLYGIMKPRYVIKDSGYKDQRITGYREIIENAGKILYVDRSDISSSDIIDRIYSVRHREKLQHA